MTTSCRIICPTHSHRRDDGDANGHGLSMIANGGRRVRPTLVDRIQDRYGHTISKHDPPQRLIAVVSPADREGA